MSNLGNLFEIGSADPQTLYLSTSDEVLPLYTVRFAGCLANRRSMSGSNSLAPPWTIQNVRGISGKSQNETLQAIPCHQIIGRRSSVKPIVP